MRIGWVAALGSLCALTSSTALAIDLELNFRVIGEVNRISAGAAGTANLQIDIDEVTAASGQIDVGSGVTDNATGVFDPAEAAIDSDTTNINSLASFDISFVVPLSLELNGTATLDVMLETSASLSTIDFNSNLSYGGSNQGLLTQGLTLESVTIAGGDSLISQGLQLDILSANTELSASVTAGGMGGDVVDLTGGVPSLVATAVDGTQQSEAGVEFSTSPLTGPMLLWTAFADPTFPGDGADEAEASFMAVRDMGVAMANLQLVEYVPEPGDYDVDGDIDADDYLEWKATFGTSVAAGEGADGNADGVIDAADYTVWRDAYQPVAMPLTGGVTSTPEPTAASLLLMLAAGVRARRRAC